MALINVSEPGQSRPAKPVSRKRAAGIDLGTTNSLVAVASHGEARVLCDHAGHLLLPSAVRYRAAGAPEIGLEALAKRTKDPGNTIVSVKRLMGRGPEDIDYRLPYRLAPAENGGMAMIDTIAGQVSPVEVSAEILKALAARGEAELGGELDGVVITVPAYFDEAQRQATRDAARIAGLKVLRLLSEPTAAAVAYGLDGALNKAQPAQSEDSEAAGDKAGGKAKQKALEQAADGEQAKGKALEQAADGEQSDTVVVYDLGGGTFDVSLMRMQKGVFEVLAIGGNSALGGDDMDRAIMGWIMREANLDEPLEPGQLAQLQQLATEAKHTLTDREEAELSFADWRGTLRRADFNALIDDLIDQTIRACRRVLRDAGMGIDEVGNVVMVGGATRCPRVREKVGAFFQRELLTAIDPDQVVAIGAALQADVLAGNKYGDETLLLDVIPLSLGVETMGGLMEKIIPRNTVIPASKAQSFTTGKDGQTAISLHVLQGERELAKDCRSLAKFELQGIPPMVAGAAIVEVTFQVDADGLMEVRAREQGAGVASGIVIKPSYGLDEKQIERMISASYQAAEQDKRDRSLKESELGAQQLIAALEAALEEDGSTLLSADEYSRLREGIAELRQLMESADAALIKAGVEQLNEASRDFAGRRMDRQIKSALAGHAIEEMEESDAKN